MKRILLLLSLASLILSFGCANDRRGTGMGDDIQQEEAQGRGPGFIDQEEALEGERMEDKGTGEGEFEGEAERDQRMEDSVWEEEETDQAIDDQ
jgi:predicted small secreted protein